MKIFRSRVRGTRRQSQPSRRGGATFRRFFSASFEPLELRSLLTGDALAGDCAMYGSANPGDEDTSSLDLSVRSMLASCGSQDGSAPSMSALAATGGDDDGEPTINPLANPNAKVHFRLEVQNTSNQPVTAMTVGQDYQLAVFVQDVRSPVANPAGVFAAFLDVTYNKDLLSIDPGATFTYGTFFSLTPSGDVTTEGEINGAGASGSSLTAPGNAEQLLWKLPVHADAIGNFSFVSSFDDEDGHDTLLYGVNSPVPIGELDFEPLNVSIFSDEIPTVSISNRTAAEGTSGTATSFVFTASLSNATAATVTVAYQTAPGTALSPADFAAQSATLTFAPGVTQQLITVLVVADALDEADEETFSVSLSNPNHATLATQSTGTGTITDDDAPPTISVTSVTQNEGNTPTNNFVFTVSLSAPSNKVVTVHYATSEDSADEGVDYTGQSGTLTFAPGQTTQLVTVNVIGDTDKEPNETFLLDLDSPTNATLSSAPDQGVGTIVNDDGPHISFVASQVSHLEGNSSTTQYVFTVTINTTDTVPVFVAYHTQNGTATTADNDYQPTSGTLTFAPDTLTQNVTVLVNGDTTGEPNENFLLILSDPTNATISQDTATGVIENDDAVLIGFADNTVNKAEGNTSTSPMLFTVTLSGQSSQTVTVQYDLQPGTATTPSDYTNTSGTLTFAPGVTSQIITVAIAGDTLSEADETFTVRLFNSTNAANATSLTAPVTATGTIEDDDVAPTLQLQNVSHPEGNTGTTEFVFTYTLSTASGQTVRVAYATHDDTAKDSDNDYEPTSGTLTFAPGETSKTVTVLVNGDTKFEPTELFSVDVSPVDDSVNLETTNAFGSIANDDLGPTVSIGNVSLSEGDTGTKQFLFTVTLTNPAAQVVTVNYATAPGTAATGTDFVGQSGSLTFENGVTQLVVTVQVNGDTLNEADETFTVNLSSPEGASLGGQTVGTGTILNDDAQPSLSINNVSHQEGDSGLTQYVFVVTLSTLSGQNVTVAYATANGTATVVNNDYQAASGTLTFGPGVTTQNITVNVVGDLLLEPNENFFVNLSNAVNATIATAQGTGTILTEASDTVVFTPSSISGYAFVDTNGNSLRDGQERSLPGVLVTLSGTSSITGSAVTQQATSGADGSYTFTGLDPGTYQVKYAQPDDYLPAHAVVGSQGGTLLTTEIGFSSTIANPGGLTGVENRLLTAGLRPEAISQREFLASTDDNLPIGAGISVAISTVTNPANQSNVANTTVTGTGTAGASISVVAKDALNSTDAVTTTVASNGTWSVSGINVTFLTQGTITYTATATFNGKTAVSTKTSTKDTLAPTVAVTTVTTPVNASNATTTTASGTGEANAKISLVVSDGTHTTTAVTTTVTAGGTWSITGINVSTLDNGTITYTATASDAAGNTATGSKTTTKDTTAPTVAVTTVTTPVNNTNVTNASASGTGEVGATISLVVTDGTHTTAAQTTTVGAGGTWTISTINLSSLDNGTITYTATASDAAGNTATDSETATKDTLVVDLTSVTNPVHNTNVTNTTASGTGEVGATISVVASDGTHSTAAATTTVIAGGTWTVSGIDVSALDDGTITYTVTSTDAGSNTVTDTLSTNKDTLAVALTVVTNPVNNSNKTNASASGTGENGATISVVVSDGTHTTSAHTTTVGGLGTWSLTGIDVSALDDGTITFTVTSTDAGGNTVTDSETTTKDVLPPTVALTLVTNPINNANKTAVGAGGTREAGAALSVVATDGVHTTTAYTVAAGAATNWSVSNMDLSGLDDGPITFTVTATDAAGNTATHSLSSTKDVEAPLVSLLVVTDPINNSNVTAGGASGTGEVGAGISVVARDGTHTTTAYTTSVIVGGTWVVSGMDLSGLDDGTVTFTVTATDAAGNTSVENMASTKDTLVVDITAATNPVNSDNVTNSGASGTGEAGATISVVASDGTHTSAAATTTVTLGGTWVVTGMNLTDLDDGPITYTVTSTGDGGNTATDTFAAAKDTAVVELLSLTSGGSGWSPGDDDGGDYAGAVDNAVAQEDFWS